MNFFPGLPVVLLCLRVISLILYLLLYCYLCLPPALSKHRGNKNKTKKAKKKSTQTLSVSLERHKLKHKIPQYSLHSLSCFICGMNVLSGLKQFAGVDDEFSHSVNLPCYYSSISEQPSLSPLERIGEACIGLCSDWSFASHRAVRQSSCTTAVMFHPPPQSNNGAF